MRGVLDALRWIVRDLRVASASPGLPLGLSAAQMFVLHVLHSEPGLSLGELADRTVTDQSSVSVVVRKLHEKKLVVKRLTTEDRRRMEVSLSASGRRLAERTPAPVQEVLIARLTSLLPEDLRRLRQLLERIAPPEATAPPMFFDDQPQPAGIDHLHD